MMATPLLLASLKGCLVAATALDDVLNCLLVKVRDPRLWHCFLKAAVVVSDRNGMLNTYIIRDKTID